jgi:hypothetical protein
MQKVETLVIRRRWKDAYSLQELNMLALALSAATNKRIRIISVATEDAEELHVSVGDE